MRSLFLLLLMAGPAAACGPTGLHQGTVDVGPPPTAAACGPTGLYQGTADVGPPPTAEVTLNLYCDGDTLKGELFTSSGDLKVLSAKPTQDGVFLHVDTYAALADITLTAEGSALSGTVDIAGDKGTIALTRIKDTPGKDAMHLSLDLTPQQWREDIDALARELPKRHANAFFFLKQPEFEAMVARLEEQVDRMDGDAVFVGLSQIVNAIGDGHTVIVTPPDRRDMPLALARFGNDFRVVSASADYANLLGAKVLKIGDVPIAEAHDRAMSLTPSQELPELREGRVVFYLARGITLHGLGIISDRNHALYTLQDDSGRIFTADVKGPAPGERPEMKSFALDTMLVRQNADDPFWCRELASDHAVYCAWHSYQDLKTKVAEMPALIARSHPAKLIIDMRDNGGGDNTVGDALLVKPLKADATYNVKGRLYVLIGPLTFSAAMNNAAQFGDETNAILVGETIGEKPNSFQEPRQFHLSNSHLAVRVSTRYYAFRKTGENAVRPDKEIIPSWDDVKASRDPVLDWVLAQPVSVRGTR